MLDEVAGSNGGSIVNGDGNAGSISTSSCHCADGAEGSAFVTSLGGPIVGDLGLSVVNRNCWLLKLSASRCRLLGVKAVSSTSSAAFENSIHGALGCLVEGSSICGGFGG